MKEVIIMRGIPGSGKSTYVQNYITLHSVAKGFIEVCSADHYHIDQNKQYKYDPTQARQAHDNCFWKFMYSPMHQENRSGVVFIDNTNTTVWEIAPYYRLAEFLSVDSVKIVTMHIPFEDAVRRNTHQVPTATMWRMYQNILSERLPSHWKEEIIVPKDKGAY